MGHDSFRNVILERVKKIKRMWKGSCMRLRKLSLWIAMVAGVGLITTGCAARYPQASIQAGFYKKMMERQKAGMALDPDPLKNLPAMTADDYENLGDNYLRQDNINMAFVQYNKAIEMKPESVNLRYKIGKLFLKKGLPQEGIKEFEAAIAKDPQYALAYEGLGQSHFEMKMRLHKVTWTKTWKDWIAFVYFLFVKALD